MGVRSHICNLAHKITDMFRVVPQYRKDYEVFEVYKDVYVPLISVRDAEGHVLEWKLDPLYVKAVDEVEAAAQAAEPAPQLPQLPVTPVITQPVLPTQSEEYPAIDLAAAGL